MRHSKALTGSASNSIVKFSVGRGGRFGNSGHRTFEGFERIDEGSTYDSLFLMFANEADYRPILDDIEKPVEEVTEDDLSSYYIDAMDYFFKIKATGKVVALEEGVNDSDITTEGARRVTLDDLGEIVYCSANRNEVGLSFEEAASGVGRIEIDGAYDTVYSKYLKDIDENELRIILDSDTYEAQEAARLLEGSSELEDLREVIRELQPTV